MFKRTKEKFLPLLRGELSAESAAALRAEIEDSPRLKREFEQARKVFDLSNALAAAEHKLPFSFTREVLRTIEERDRSLFTRIRESIANPSLSIFGSTARVGAAVSVFLIVMIISTQTLSRDISTHFSTTASMIDQRMASAESGGLSFESEQSAPSLRPAIGRSQKSTVSRILEPLSNLLDLGLLRIVSLLTLFGALGAAVQRRFGLTIGLISTSILFMLMSMAVAF